MILKIFLLLMMMMGFCFVGVVYVRRHNGRPGSSVLTMAGTGS